MTDKFCQALELNIKESSYFRHLVLFNQAQNATEKQEHYAVLRSMSRQVKEGVLKANQYAYFEKWYNVVIREVVCLKNFYDDYEQIAAMIQPAITARQAKKSVKLLLDLNLIQIKSEGEYIQTNRAIIADDSISSMVLKSYITEMSGMTGAALQKYPNTERNISSLCLKCSKSAYDAMAAELVAFKDRLKLIAQQDEGSTHVYQLNLGLFPVSKNIMEDDKASGGDS